MAKQIFKVQARNLLGKKVKQLRRELVVPGNVYGVNSESQAVKFDQADFEDLYERIGETSVVYLKIVDQEKDQEKEYPVLIDEVQLEPVDGQPLHVSFKEVDLTKKIEAEVPLEIIGEFDVAEAVMVQTRNNIEVRALPNDLPDKFVVDVSILEEIGQMITLADLDFDRDKVELLEVETEEDLEKPVVLVQEQREEEEEEVAEPEDVEILGEGEEAEEGTEEAETEKKEAEGDEGKEATENDEEEQEKAA